MKHVVVLDGEAAFLMAAYLRRRVGPRARITYVSVDGHSLDARIIGVLEEDGVDVEGWQRAIVDLHMGEPFDVVITLSEKARDQAPFIPAAYHIHCPFTPEPAPREPQRNMAQIYRLRNEVKFFSERVANDLLLALAS